MVVTSVITSVANGNGGRAGFRHVWGVPPHWGLHQIMEFRGLHQRKNILTIIYCSLEHRRMSYPVSTGILPHSLPEWAFRARPGLWRNCLCPKVARIAERKFGSR